MEEELSLRGGEGKERSSQSKGYFSVSEQGIFLCKTDLDAPSQ